MLLTWEPTTKLETIAEQRLKEEEEEEQIMNGVNS